MKFLIKLIGIFFLVTNLVSAQQIDPRVQFLFEKGIISKTNINFSASVNRAEFTKMAIIATQKPENIFGNFCFSDVKNEWFAPFVCTASREIIVGGYHDETFRPSENITVLQSIKIIVRAFGFESWGDPVWEKEFFSEKDVPKTMLDFHRDLSRDLAIEMFYRLLSNPEN